MKETIVLDDVVTPELQELFRDQIMTCPKWQFIPDMTYAEAGTNPFPAFGFNMTLKHPDFGVTSTLYESISVPIINAVMQKTSINITDIFYNRAFLQVPLETRFNTEHNGIHIDVPRDHYACVYYLNDADGDTIIYEQTIHDTPFGAKDVNVVEHKRVTPKKGRFVMFDGTRYHCSSQPRNGYRCIINFDLL